MALEHPAGADLSYSIIGAAIEVHRNLGPGLFESAYRSCLVYELERQRIRTQVEVPVPLMYRGIEINPGYRLDLLVDDAIVVEIKAIEALTSVHRAQLLTYLRLTGLKAGLLLNFHVAELRQGIRRVLL